MKLHLTIVIFCVFLAAPVLAAPDDGAISDAVEDEVLLDPAVSLNDLEVETRQGVVVFSGTVDNLLAKRRATRIAESVRGVRAVVNRIEVDTPWTRSDADVAEDVRDSLLYDRATESFEITVTVRDGTATLRGQVDSWQEKQLAEKVAAGVRGVTAVENELSVEYDADRPDSEIQVEVERALRWNARIDDGLVEVEVDDGVVTLTGTVGSAAEKKQARYDAWVLGVSEVDTSGLEVARWARDEDMRAKKYVDKSDAEIRQAVEDAFVYDPRVLSFDIDTKVENGIVTLTGRVDNLKAKRAAEMDARHTVGVLDVRNRIRVNLTAPSDDRIAENVRDALLWDPYVERYEIDVDVANGIVTLRGEVDTYFEKARADSIASTAHGAQEVRNLLDVEFDEAPLVYDPFLDDYDHWIYEWYDYHPPVTYQSDVRIEADIEDELWWSPFIDSDEVEVEVEDGVATLTGTVDTWAERRTAAENAYAAGAIWVDNDILVQ